MALHSFYGILHVELQRAEGKLRDSLSYLPEEMKMRKNETPVHVVVTEDCEEIIDLSRK